MDTVFVTAANATFQNMANGLMNSIKKFYPDMPVFCHPYNDTIGTADRGTHYDFNYDSGRSYDYLLPYFEKYKRVIDVNADYVMTNYCPELFEDYEYQMPYNNIDFYCDKSFDPPRKYIQNSLIVCTNPEIFKTLTEMNKKERATTNHPHYDMNTSNDLFYSGKYKTRALSFPDKSYGIEEMHVYHTMYTSGDDLYVTDHVNNQHITKKVCMMHFSGVQPWKIPSEGKILFDNILNEAARNRIKELIQ